MELCQICEKRRPRRYCPGVRGDICPRCCGEEREVTVNCPFECEYLQEARLREKPPELKPEDVPNKEIEVSDRFLRENSPLLMHAGNAVLQAALQTQGAVDYDVRETLEAMIKTHLTRESGIIYESRPSNPYAANIQQLVIHEIGRFREAMAQQSGTHAFRDRDVLGVLVFLQRVELQRNNGRRRGRAFLHFLHQNFPPPEVPGEKTDLLAP